MRVPSRSAAVSVIVPTRNRHTLLEEALVSIADQTIHDWEVVVVDDGSVPPVSSTAIGSRFGARVHVVRHTTSQGGAAAKNTGIRAATASVITFLDDDDLYTPAYLEKALSVIQRCPEIDVLFMGVSWFGAGGEWAEKEYVRAMGKTLKIAQGKRTGATLVGFGSELLTAMLQSVPMAFQRPVVRRDALRTIGDYHDGCLLWDCDWAIRAAIYGRTALLEERLYRQRLDGQNLSTRPNIELDHHRSNIEIKERLLRSLEKQGDREIAAKMRAAAASAWMTLAYYYSIKGNPSQAISAWCRGQRYQALRKRYVDFTKLILRSLLNQRLRSKQDSTV